MSCWHQNPSAILHLFHENCRLFTFFRDLGDVMTCQTVVSFQVGELMFLCLWSAAFTLLQTLVSDRQFVLLLHKWLPFHLKNSQVRSKVMMLFFLNLVLVCLYFVRFCVDLFKETKCAHLSDSGNNYLFAIVTGEAAARSANIPVCTLFTT